MLGSQEEQTQIPTLGQEECTRIHGWKWSHYRLVHFAYQSLDIEGFKCRFVSSHFTYTTSQRPDLGASPSLPEGYRIQSFQVQMGQDHLHLPFSGNIVPISAVTKTFRKRGDVLNPQSHIHYQHISYQTQMAKQTRT